MDNQLKVIYFFIAVVMFLIVAKFIFFNDSLSAEELIPGVTDDDMMVWIDTNSTVGEIIFNESFRHNVAGVSLIRTSELYGTNESKGRTIFNRCRDSLTVTGMNEIRKEEGNGRFIGVFSDDTYQTIFYVFEGEDVRDLTGFNIILIVYRGLV